jgi:hypothetical protein
MVEVYKALFEALYKFNRELKLVIRKEFMEAWLKDRGYGNVNLKLDPDLLIVNSIQKGVDWDIELKPEDQKILDDCYISTDYVLAK